MERPGTDTQPGRTMEVCMNIERIDTFAGAWYTFEPLTRDDVEAQFRTMEPELRENGANKAAYSMDLVVRPKLDVLDKIMVAVGDLSEVGTWALWDHYYKRVRPSTFEELVAAACASRYLRIDARLRSVRREDTRKARIAEAREKILGLANSSRPERIALEVVEAINTRIQAKVDAENSKTKQVLVQNLATNSSWAEHADKLADNDEVKREVDELTAEHDALRERLVEKRRELRKVRGEAWMRPFEDGKMEVPDEMMTAMRTAIDEDNAFTGEPRLRLSGF